MKINILFIILSHLILALLLIGCGSKETLSEIETAKPVITSTKVPVTSTITATPDLCAPGNIQASVDKVHRHMREFDDSVNLVAANLVAGIPRDQLSSAISDLQTIRREAEDEQVPPCLENLKSYQVQHMNSGINYFLGFMSGGDQKSLDQVFAIARQLHDQYTLELASVLGLIVVPATAIITPQETPTP